MGSSKHRHRHRGRGDRDRGHDKDVATDKTEEGGSSTSKFWLIGVLVIITGAFIAGYSLSDHTHKKVATELKEQQDAFMNELKSYLMDSSN